MVRGLPRKYKVRHVPVVVLLLVLLVVGAPRIVDEASEIMFGGFSDTSPYVTYPPYSTTYRAAGDWVKDRESVSMLFSSHKIKNIAVWSVRLREWLLSDYVVLYHAYLVIETLDRHNNPFYWSLEKNATHVFYQQSPIKEDVVYRVDGRRRLYYTEPELLVEEEFTTGNTTLQTLHENGDRSFRKHKSGYKSFSHNCKHFVEEMFNLMTHKVKYMPLHLFAQHQTESSSVVNGTGFSGKRIEYVTYPSYSCITKETIAGVLHKDLDNDLDEDLDKIKTCAVWEVSHGEYCVEWDNLDLICCWSTAQPSEVTVGGHFINICEDIRYRVLRPLQA